MAAEQPRLEVVSAAVGLAVESVASLAAEVERRLPFHARAQVRVHAPTRATDSLWAGVVAATAVVVVETAEDAQAPARDFHSAAVARLTAAQPPAAVSEVQVSAVQWAGLLGCELPGAQELRQGSRHFQFRGRAQGVPLV
jgi:hypothetical protein